MQIFQNFLPILQNYIENYGSLGVFIASIVEELIPPIPSAFVQGMGGLLLMMNEPVTLFNFLKLILVVSVPAALGVCIGSLPYWYLAERYGIQIIEQYGKYLGTNKSDWKKLETRMDRSNHDEFFFVLARTFPFVPAIVLAVYAGAINMPFTKYFTLSFLGIVLRATFLATIGWVLGHQFLKNLAYYIESVEKIVLLAIFATIIYIFYKNFSRLTKNLKS